MQKLVESPSYPKALPEATRRKGGLTYEIRVRVPPNARGDKFKGTHTSRSLRTRDLAEARRRLPGVYNDLQCEFDDEIARLKAAPGSPPTAAPVITPQLRDIPISEACQRYRDHILASERQTRLEAISGARNTVGKAVDGQSRDLARGWSPVELATMFRERLEAALKHARAEAIVLDYSHSDWFLSLIEREASGQVQDRSRCLREMARTKIRTLRDLLEDDDALMPASSTTIPTPTVVAISDVELQTTPILSKVVSQYISRRGTSLSTERADTIRATVRDLISVVGDKPVDTYDATDAEAYEGILRTLPGNWHKRGVLRTLDIKDAATKAMSLGLPPQAPKTIRKKWTILFGVFKHAAIKHRLHNPFVAEALLIDDAGPVNAQWDAFKTNELVALLSSDLPGHLHWLTHLGLYTGARLNELCQLTSSHVRQHDDISYIYFSPELRLKTGERESCVRSVPLHRDLIEEGFLDYVRQCDGLLFPGIPQHKTGRFSDAPSKAFSRHLKAIGIKRPKLSFHSLRHTFTAAFKRHAPRDAETRERLLGHSDNSVAGRYGNDYASEAYDMVLLVERAKILGTVQLVEDSKN